MGRGYGSSMLMIWWPLLAFLTCRCCSYLAKKARWKSLAVLTMRWFDAFYTQVTMVTIDGLVRHDSRCLFTVWPSCGFLV